jgi:hypothetical protein
MLRKGKFLQASQDDPEQHIIHTICSITDLVRLPGPVSSRRNSFTLSARKPDGAAWHIMLI